MLIRTLLSTCVLVAALRAQAWSEIGGGNLPTSAETTIGVGALTQINGWLLPGDQIDIFLIRVDDPATFTCSTIGGATWDTQLWLFGRDGRGIAFKDDDPGDTRSTLTGQFLTGPGPVFVAISRRDNDAVDANLAELWLDAPADVERQPDGPAAGSAIEQWNGQTAGGNAAYSMTLTGASFALRTDRPYPDVGWALVEPPPGLPATFIPALEQQHTPSGGVISVQRLGLGQYLVLLSGMSPWLSVPHATAWRGSGTTGPGLHTPVVYNWGAAGAGAGVNVQVFNASGQLVDAPFTLHYRGFGEPLRREAFLWAHDSTSASYTTLTNYVYNGSRPNPTIARTAVGRYSVRLPQLGGSSSGELGHVQVTAVNGLGSSGTLRRASVLGWTHGAVDVSVDVGCYDSAGQPADSRFVLSYHEIAAPIPAQLGSGAHVRANHPTLSSYAPLYTHADSNGVHGPANLEQVHREGVGRYRVHLPNVLPTDSATAQATAYGAGAFASILDWAAAASSTGTEVFVETRDAGGVAVDAEFTLLFLTNHPAGTAARNAFVGAGCHGFGMDVVARPLLGSSWTFRLYGIPAGTFTGTIAFGLDNPNFGLDPLGAPGCKLHVISFGNQLLLPVTTTPAVGLMVPATTALLGATVLAQAAVLATGLNPLGVATSNAIRGTLGDV